MTLLAGVTSSLAKRNIYNIHDSGHEYRDETKSVPGRQLEFRNRCDRYAEDIDVGREVYSSESFVGVDDHLNIGEDVKEHQNRVSEETNGHTDICQISGESVYRKDAEVQQQEREFEGEHGRRVDYADVFAEL